MYITSELKAQYGVTVKGWSSKNAFAPDGAVRVLDTANKFEKEDFSHMSPHKTCNGQGVGDGGAYKRPYANCVPVGNILVVQAADFKDRGTRANSQWSFMSFTFDQPVDLLGVLFLESTGTKAASYAVSS
jgi:hypothetical protein